MLAPDKPKTTTKPSLRSIDREKHKKLEDKLLPRIRKRNEANRKDLAILEGVARDLDRIESPAESCARLYKARVREYHRGVRFTLTGERSKDPTKETSESKLFEVIFTRFRKAGFRPARISYGELQRTKLSRRLICYRLRRLRKLGIVNWTRGIGRGNVRVFNLPTYPLWETYKRTFMSTYTFDDGAY